MPGTPPKTIVIDAAQLEKGFRRTEGATSTPDRFQVVEELPDGQYRVIDPGLHAIIGDWPPDQTDPRWGDYCRARAAELGLI